MLLFRPPFDEPSLPKLLGAIADGKYDGAALDAAGYAAPLAAVATGLLTVDAKARMSLAALGEHVGKHKTDRAAPKAKGGGSGGGGGAGERVELDDGTVLINGEVVEEGTGTAANPRLSGAEKEEARRPSLLRRLSSGSMEKKKETEGATGSGGKKAVGFSEQGGPEKEPGKKPMAMSRLSRTDDSTLMEEALASVRKISSSELAMGAQLGAGGERSCCLLCHRHHHHHHHHLLHHLPLHHLHLQATPKCTKRSGRTAR